MIVFDDTCRFDKVIAAKGAEEFCAGSGWEGVTWTGEVIADGDRRVWADEYGTGIEYFFGDVVTFFAALDLKVFGGEIVGIFDNRFKFIKYGYPAEIDEAQECLFGTVEFFDL